MKSLALQTSLVSVHRSCSSLYFAMDFYKNSSAFFLFFLLWITLPFLSVAEIPREIAEKIERVNRKGELYGLVVSSRAELEVVLDERSGTFRPDRELPTIDISARRFHVGEIGGHRSLVVMCGRGMVNAAQTTQLMVTLFRVKAVVEYGRGSSANPRKLNIGDVAIPRQFAHTGLIFWEKFGGDDERFDRDIANLTFSDYNVGKSRGQVANELQSIYPQREEVYSMRGKAEEGRRQFWLNVDNALYTTAQQLEKVELDKCTSVEKASVCLQEQPRIKRVERGSSSNFYVNNEAYRNFLRDQLNVVSIDTSSAAIAMVCESENKPFIAMRSITDCAGGCTDGNDITVMRNLWPHHARKAINQIFTNFAFIDSNIHSVA
ncbi:bark storage protein A [Cryptomeria japonica]|uniref:bark storage protein A n=1 Tax=Cryptomeria japonica TaxID=3369 RepID=UPI0025AD25A6|nr:bark storage protein A [Cryptomeria japonica]